MVQENHATVKPVSSVASRRMKTYSETRIELRNLQILRKMLDNSSQFLSSEQPSELKNLDVALNIAGVVKIRSENLRLFFFFFFCILYIFIDWKLHTFFSQTNIVHINRQTRYIIYLHTHPTVPLNSNLLLNIIQVQRSNNARFYIHLIVFILAPFHIMSF